MFTSDKLKRFLYAFHRKTKIKTSNTERSPLTVTYNRTLRDLKTIIDKNWHNLQIEPKLKEIITEALILAFKRNKNLRNIIGGNKVFDNKKNWNVKKFNKGKCQPFFTRSINLCCKQLKTCLTFQSVFNKNIFLIRHKVTCKSSRVIYPMKCCLCEKLQYIGKSEYSLNLRINIHRNMFGEQMVHRVTSIFKCQFIISILTLSLPSLKRFIISHYQS